MDEQNERPQGIYINTEGTQAYVVAIIDALTDYSSLKKGEHLFKKVRYCGNSMSCIPPPDYAKRFIKFLDSIFKAEEPAIVAMVTPGTTVYH